MLLDLIHPRETRNSDFYMKVTIFKYWQLIRGKILINLHEPSKTYLPFTFKASDLLCFLLISFVAFCKQESDGLTGISVDFGLREELCILRFSQVPVDGQIHAR